MAAPWIPPLRTLFRFGVALLLGLLTSAGCEDEPTDIGDSIPPEAPDDLIISGVTTSALTIRWTAPGDDGARGTATRYDIRHSSISPQSESWWDSSTVAIPDPPSPRAAGAVESLTIQGLVAETDYHIAVRAADEESNWSPISNIASARTAAWPDTVPPSAISDLAVDSITDSSLTLVWTASGDDGSEGSANRYDLRHASEEIGEDNWAAAVAVENPPLPAPSGTVQRFELTGLIPDQQYWFAIRTIDESSNESPISNPASGSPDGTPPPAIRDLRMAATTPSSVTLEWTSPGTQGLPDDAAVYDLRFALDPVAEDSWDAATPATGLPAPGEPGVTERFKIEGLAPNALHYFAIKTGDRIPNWSAISNIALGVTQESSGRIIRVAADGSGDFPAIREAVAAATAGDIVELEDGVYTGAGNRGISFGGKAITLRSRSGDPQTCILDCEGVSRAFSFLDDEGDGSILQGITIRNGFAGGSRGRGGAIIFSGDLSPTISDCIFESNRAIERGGAAYSDQGAHPRFLRSRFQGNSARLEGGGIGVLGGTFIATECLFIQNEAGLGGAIGGYGSWRLTRSRFRENYAVGAEGYESMGGALSVWGSPRIEECVFDLNQASEGGAIMALFGWPTIANCTFALNQAERGGAISLHGGTLTIERVIIAYDLSPESVAITDYLPTFVCSNMFGNQDGNWAGEFAGQERFQGNMEVDPRFCDLEQGDFHLLPDSPCAPGASGCGWIGGGTVGCEGIAAPRPWLRLER